MKHNVFTVRLRSDLCAQVVRDAARRQLRPGTWVNHLVERGNQAEQIEHLLKAEIRSRALGSGDTSSIPPAILQRLIFASCFAEALLQNLNERLNRSASEVGVIARQARDQAEAETMALLKTVAETAKE